MKRRDALKSFAALGVLPNLSASAFADNTHIKKVHIIGLGGAGCNVLEYFHGRGVAASYTCINNRERTGISPVIEFIPFNPPVTRLANGKEGNGFSDMDKPLVISAAIKNLFSKDHHYVLLAGIGGYTGTYMTSEIAEWLYGHKKDFTAICSLPFAFETGRRSVADQLQTTLQAIPNIKYYDPEMLREQYGHLKMNTVFEKVNGSLFDIYEESKKLL